MTQATLAPPPERIMASADIFLPGSAYLHLAQGDPAELGWWVVRRGSSEHASVADAFLLAPDGLCHEVLIETERLVAVATRHRGRPDLDAPAWQVAVARLRESLCAARELLRDDERMRDRGRTLADQLPG